MKNHIIHLHKCESAITKLAMCVCDNCLGTSNTCLAHCDIVVENNGNITATSRKLPEEGVAAQVAGPTT